MRFFRTSLFLSVLPCLISATTFNSEWGNFLYLRQDRIDSSRSLVNYYEGLNFQVRKISGTDISAFACVNATNGFVGLSRKNIEVVHGYVDWDDIAKSIDLRLGRQRIFKGIKPVYIDGLRLQARIGSAVEVFGYGGARVVSRYSPDYFAAQIDSNGFDAGLRAQARIAHTLAGLTFHQSYTGTTSADREAAIDVSQFFDNAYARSFLTYSIASRAVQGFQITGSWQPVSRLDLFGSVSRSNEARIDSSNIFLIKVFRDYYEADASASYLISKKLQSMVGYSARMIDKAEPAHEAYCRVNNDRFSGKLTQRWGYGGTETRADIGAQLVNVWILGSRLDAGFLRYTRDDSPNTAQLAWIGDFSIAALPIVQWWNFRIGIQAMGNPFYDYDVRAYLQTRIQFARFFK